MGCALLFGAQHFAFFHPLIIAIIKLMPLNHNKLSWLKLYAINFWIEVNYLDVSTKCKETEHIEEIEKKCEKIESAKYTYVRAN